MHISAIRVHNLALRAPIISDPYTFKNLIILGPYLDKIFHPYPNASVI